MRKWNEFMAWRITEDHVADATTNRAGSGNGPHGLTMPIKFRLYDDDDNLYYEGVMSEKQFDLYPFGPLDFGRADAGCTRLDYLEPGSKEWRTL